MSDLAMIGYCPACPRGDISRDKEGDRDEPGELLIINCSGSREIGEGVMLGNVLLPLNVRHRMPSCGWDCRSVPWACTIFGVRG